MFSYEEAYEESLKYFLTRAFYGLYVNGGNICYAPLETMRGATFHNAYMLLDEAQNCTFEQIKMFICLQTTKFPSYFSFFRKSSHLAIFW